jgi:hypothetical protein
MSNMSNDFTVVDDNDDDFQELLNGIEIAPVVPGKSGGGRSANNIGAEVLGRVMLAELRTNHHVNLSTDLASNTLWGVIDQKSFDRAQRIARKVEDKKYSQTGILAVSLVKAPEGEFGIGVMQWWKATLVNGVLAFQKAYRKGADYQLCVNPQGGNGIYKIDAKTSKPSFTTDKNGNKYYIPFPYAELVSFEDYLNAVVTTTEAPVSFPEEEVSNLQGLSEILANVNLNSTVITNVEVETNSTQDANDIDEDEDEFEEEEV